jgi:hypothetical protein
MKISDFGLAMYKPLLTLGGKNSVFMTQQAYIYVDALLCK